MLLNIQYFGEHTQPGQLGRIFIVIALAMAFLSFLAYIFGNIRNDQRLIRTGRLGFLLHFLFVVLASAVLFYLLSHGYWEYDYVWKHTASYLPTKFIISAFWAGQEGSFLLWVFLEALLGVILIFTSKKWEAYVMPVLAMGQFLLTTMVWGIRPLGLVLGKSPFMLMRNDPINAGVEFFQDPNYLAQITDGNGINPLLENIWMVTHPPLLFLGYAAAIIPFAYAIGALWKRDYKEWLKPAFPWMIVALSTLGGGILLGGAWAYESLTFGGFWAWDPVENASLIPWLIILSAMHMMIINRKQNHSYAMSFALVILGFVFVVYASYLTRSGVLGETSAHAFGNNGLAAQMIIIIFLTLAVSAWLYIRNYKHFPKTTSDNFLSREFWMFIGSIILALSAFQIFITTSIPVINKVFGTALAPPLDRVAFYNKWQLSFGILIVLSIGISLLLKYGKNDLRTFTKRLGIAFISSLVLFGIEMWIFHVWEIGMMVFLFSINFTLAASVDYFVRHNKGAYNFSNSVSHLGFGIMMLGIVVAFSTAEVISTNTSRYDLGGQEMNRENQLLIRNEYKELGKYLVKYKSLRRDKNHLYYTLEFMTKDTDGKLKKAFDLHPSINVNSRMGNVYDPDTYHSFSKDVFTYISYADIKADLSGEENITVLNKEIGPNDTIPLGPSYLVKLDSIYVDQGAHTTISVDNVTINARMILTQNFEQNDTFKLSYKITDGQLSHGDYYSDVLGYTFSFDKVGKTPGQFVLKVTKKRMDFIVVKTTVFPYISLMWIGVLIMFSGLAISFYRNTKISLRKSD